jgi:hypothetical protein|tara:strand:+ start:857 stop:1048 length:192 start_codon:yes stop_codon:yes gene_type:complete
MFVITKTDVDDLMFDILSEDGGQPMLFKTKLAASQYIDYICEQFNIPPDVYMLNDGIEISRMH